MNYITESSRYAFSDLMRSIPVRIRPSRFSIRLRDTAQEVDAARIGNARDLTGRIFQRLISERKYLATFYMRPAISSLALLVRLAVADLN